MNAIQVININKSYKNIRALDNVNMDVNEGEIFGLIGPDGAGKTTLFRMLATLLLADKGHAIVLGKDVVKEYKQIRHLIGYMPGRFSLYQDLSVEENIHFYATIFKTTLSENYELVKPIYSQIEPFKNRRAGKLSGGMKQKLALSCALIHKPRLLLLDEPTTGVDAVSRKEFWEMLKILKKNGMTILVSTSYMDEAGLCDRIALIQKGKILSVDTPKGITNQFNKDLFEIRTGDMYRLIRDLEEYTFSHSTYPFGRYVHYIDKRTKADPKILEDYLSKKSHHHITVRKIRASVEDCFMELMSH